MISILQAMLRATAGSVTKSSSADEDDSATDTSSLITSKSDSGLGESGLTIEENDEGELGDTGL